MAKFGSQNEKRLYITEIVSALVGILVSFYLLIQHTRLTSGIQDGASFCSIGKYADCDVVNGSRYAELLGVPLGAWGASFFFLLLALVLIAPPRDKSFRFFQSLVGWLACLGLLADLFYLGVQIFDLQSLCLLCLLTYVCNIGLIFGALRLTPGTGSRLSTLLYSTDSWFVPSFRNTRVLLAVVSWILFSVVSLLVPAQILKKSANYVHADQAIEQFFEQWKNMPTRKIDVSDGNGTWGNPQAKVVIVEFSDFECPFCRKAAFSLHTVLKPLKDKVFFVFKNFPLDSTCNPAVPYQIHAHACKLAKLSICGQLTGKFWDVHDTLFLKLDEDDMKKGYDHISSSMKGILSDTEMQTCLQDPKVASLLAEDVKLGQSLNVRGTPYILINGKQITIPITIENLRRIIDLETKIQN